MSAFEIPDWAMPAPEPVAAPEPVDPAALREQQIADTTRAEQGLNRFLAAKHAMLFEEPDAFYRQQGEDAIHAAPVTTQKLDELRQNLLDKLGNDAQRQRLGEALDAQMHLTRDGVSRHVAEQSLAWQRQVAQDRIALLIKEAAYHHNDDDRIDALGYAADSAARAHARVGDGLDQQAENAAAALARSGVLGSAIRARFERGDTQGANAFLTRVQTKLDPQHAELLLAQLNPPPTPVAVEQLSDSAEEPLQPGVQLAEAAPLHEPPKPSVGQERVDRGNPKQADAPLNAKIPISGRDSERYEIQPKVDSDSINDLPIDRGQEIDVAADNQRQNKMVRDIQVQLGLTVEQREQLHRAISGKGYSYQEILIEAKSMFGK
ncbi:MAG: hypothetical protein JSR24_23965 [Proteobacteria bacterium]|nr:hypothetical protein [Pseudomonadota bacterium]